MEIHYVLLEKSNWTTKESQTKFLPNSSHKVTKKSMFIECHYKEMKLSNETVIEKVQLANLETDDLES